MLPCFVGQNLVKLIATLQLPSPIQRLEHPLCRSGGLELWVKREDLIHPQLGGNKWRKLRYNLFTAQRAGKRHLLTFGGAYSNHLYASAAAAHRLGWSSIGIVRGEAPPLLNPTLRFARARGMNLRFVSRSAYRRGLDLLDDLDWDADATLVLPEGGTNLLALRGNADLAEEIHEQLGGWPDCIALACGTGGTAAGLIAGLEDRSTVLGFSVLKGNFHRTAISNWLAKYRAAFTPDLPHTIPENWSINLDYHFGGYARFRPELVDWINQFTHNYQIPLDPIYTGKLFYGLLDLIERGYFAPGSRILVLHSGGLQGIAGFNERHGHLIKTVEYP